MLAFTEGLASLGSSSPILIVAPCRMNAAFRPGSERRIYAAARWRSENGLVAKAKMRIAA